MRFIQSLLLLFVFVAVYCSAEEAEDVQPGRPPFPPNFGDFQSFLAQLKQMSNDPSVASFLQESKAEIDIYDHVKAVMEQYASERQNDIKYRSSVIVDQPNHPRSVTVYLEKDGEKLSCGLSIAVTRTLTDFQEFTLRCIGGLQFRRRRVRGLIKVM